MINPKNAWAWLGQGDVRTWLKRPQDAARAYEQALELNPFFDVARQRLIILYTTEARKLASAKHWSAAQAMLTKLLDPVVPESWVPYQKEAYLLRSEVRQKLNQPAEAIEDLSVVLHVDPTNMNALLSRGKLYREQLQGRLAKDDFERACILGSSEACEQLP
jgi:tetratricopeptide (TPR) repeat protein